MKGFEARLTEASSPEALKQAKALLKSGALFGVHRTGDGFLAGEFQEKTRQVHAAVRPGELPHGSCDGHGDSERLCEHAVALLMYAGRFGNVLREPCPDENARYAGLKFEDFVSLSARVNPAPAARVSIEAMSAFPHVPSKWEHAVLNVRLRAGEREYLGNLNNLRQLYFDKILSAALKLEAFSLHDQQIIRFLAVSGEAENSMILLNSEQAAEFFHCLVGFERFTLEGRKLFVRPDRAEAVVLKDGKGCVTPGIRVRGGAIPIIRAKVITGRSGCWVGCHGEYFFVPATADITWLRNFFRNGPQPESSKSSDWPLPVLEHTGFTDQAVRPKILLGGEGDENGGFRLRVQYVYPQGACHPRSGRLLQDGGVFALRDANREREFEQELEMFGFVADDAAFVLRSLEATGLFLDKVLSIWMRRYPELCLEGPLAQLSRGGEGLPEAEIRCRKNARTSAGHLISYEITGGGGILSWSELLELVHSGLNYASVGARRLPVRLGSKMRRFLSATDQIIRSLNEKERTFELPFYSVDFFLRLAASLPGALPEGLANDWETPSAEDTPPAFSFSGELRSYQQAGRDWILRMTDHRFNVILADEMGLGKTIQLLSVLAARHRRGEPPSLVICPASLVENWARECRRFVPDFRVAAPQGAARDEIWSSLKDYDLIVISYAAARRDVARLRSLRFGYLVLDEAQHIKNPGTANAQDCKSIRAAHKIVLSGTPLENSPEDLWSIFDFLQPGMLGTLAGFRRYYAGIMAESDRRDELAMRIAPFIRRRTKKEVAAELPPKQEFLLYCTMEEEQRKLYDETREIGRRQLAAIKPGENRGNAEIFTTLLRLRQICCHPELLPEKRGDGTPSTKMELFQELVLENIDSGHKILVFSQFTTLLEKIARWLDSNGLRYEYLDGATRNRQQRVDHFNEDNAIPVFLLSLKAGGTGLNLTSADTVVLFDPWWNPAAELQAADRTHRIGQTRPVSSLKLLVRDSIEEKMLLLQQRKQELFDQVIDNPKTCGEKFTIDELRALLD